MATIKESDVNEETIYFFDCPECGEISDNGCDEPRDGDTVFCEHCHAVIDVEE